MLAEKAGLVIVIMFGAVWQNVTALSISDELAQETVCQVYDTCSSCILAESFCVWCYQQDFSLDRCGPKSLLVKQGCKEHHILYSDNSTIVNIDSDKAFSDVTSPYDTEGSVQIKPQRISIKLKPKQPLTLQFRYRLAKNYPLDLYYLMDLTLTMEPDVATMTSLGKELTEVLQNLTRYYKVAFGYYSDKVAMPFSKMTKKLIENPCDNINRKCRKGFDFVHSLNFTENIDEFIKKVSSSKTTANLDNLEGGFDALYQIILCGDKIKWRKNSRKIIVVATDGTLHTAGDGKLAGAIKRNPSRCFLDENGVYSKSLEYDYPSLEEVYRRLLMHKMNVLFAAKSDALKHYQALNKVIPSVSYVGLLANESSNVLNLVKEGYLQFVQNVKFSANHSDNLKVSFASNCIQVKSLNRDSMCDNVEQGKMYEFNVTLEVVNLPQNTQRETVTIEEQNINEKLIVDVEYIGRCDCQTDSQNAEADSCSNHGTFRCGICECEEGWKGNKCEVNCLAQRFEECRMQNESFTSSVCYGRGECFCGKCRCDEEYTGKYCQERQCPKGRSGMVCSGPLHGFCQDGTCQCSELYSGPDCSCATSNKNCIAPGNDEICSARGYCRCNRCVCSPNYSGDFCEICPTCTGLCSTYEKCVLDALANVTDSENCFTEDGTNFIAQIVDHSIPAEDTTTCYIRHEKEDGRSCNAQYKYNIKKNLIVELQIYDECWETVKAGVMVGIIIGVIVGIGTLIILLWKAKLMNDDRREYAKFQENLQRSRTLETNPLYNSPIRTYEMPLELQQHRQ